MELGNQIKHYRKQFGYSQEDLAEHVYVTRQSISNWETNKTYPDINSLILLSQVFSISLDQLIKGDIDIMKQEINQQDLITFNKHSIILTIMFIIMIVIPIPLMWWLGYIGIGIWIIIVGITLYYACLVEKYKKKYDIQTYREIVSFIEGKNLNKIEKARESGKRIYQKCLLVIASTIIGFSVSMIILFIINLLN